MKRKNVLFIIVGCSFLFTACSGQTAQEEIYDHLEETAALEEPFEKAQNQLNDLENEERELYEKIIAAEKSEMDKIKKLSDEALDNVEERKDKLKSENESIQSARGEFEEVASSITDIEENDEAESAAESMVDTMNKRYSAYEDIHSLYEEMLKMDEELYVMLKQEDAGEEELRAQITSVNDKFTEIEEVNETFNEKTEEFNERKKEYYKASDLNVKYKNNEG